MRRGLSNENDAYRADALVRKGVGLAARGKLTDAISRLEEAVSCAPNHPFGHLHLSLAIAREGRVDEARPHLDRAIELQPDNAAFRLFAGRVHFDAGDYRAAAREFDRGMQVNPENDLLSAYQALNMWAAGDRDAPKRFIPDNLPDSTPFLARLLMLIEAELKGRFIEFSEEHMQVPLVDRLRIGYSLWWAALERKRGRFAKASMRAEMALEIQPGHPGATAFLGECREASLLTAQRRVEEDPASSDLRIDLGSQLVDTERYKEAESQLEEAQRLLSERDTEEALARPEISRLRGRIAYGLGRFEEALGLQRAGAEPGFVMAETHYCIGLCYLAMGEPRLCIQEFEPLVTKVCWAVPMRLREYLAWRRARPEPEAGT